MVIVLDALANCYPLIHQDWVFLRALGESVEEITAESRRLFYVALTRASESLVLFTDKRGRSPFLDDLETRVRLPAIRWLNYPPVISLSERTIVMV